MTHLRHTLERWLGLLVVVLLTARPAQAHDGPPFPIFVDEELSGWTVSIWADPDVGTGTFYYYLEAPAGRSVAGAHLRVSAEPADGLSPAVSGLSEAAQPGEPFQQIGTLLFHHRGPWHTRFVLVESEPEGAVLGELELDLDVTPPGLGAVDILWFAFPFLVFGGIWVRVLLAQRAHDRKAAGTPSIQP